MTTSRASAGETARNDWYRDSIVNLHIDNHSSLVGKGYTVEQLTEMMRNIPVSLIQVSAFGATGLSTFPTDVRPAKNLGDWDTLAAWRQVARNLNKRFCVYINTRGYSISKDYPQWMQIDSKGKGKGRGGFDVCPRPSPRADGCLEKVFLPLVGQIASRYQPDGIWVDGDHARTPACYCVNCKAAWQALTGEDAPRAGPADSGWPRWLAFEQERYDYYRRRMGEEIHKRAEGCMYTSNHSWRFKSKDPRNAPEWVDTLSGDLSHGASLQLTRLSSMHLSPVEELPVDIMHCVNQPGRGVQRVLQQGALTMAGGGAWFLWVSGSTIVQPEAQQRAKLCAEFARDREAALGRSVSLNPVAVLLSENDWRRQTIDGVAGRYDDANPQNLALALQDAGYAVDTVNEAILRKRIRRYRAVVVVNQKDLAAETVAALGEFVSGGGALIIAGDGLRPNPDREQPQAAEWLGLTRGGEKRETREVELGPMRLTLRSTVEVEPGAAEILARFPGGAPLLTRHALGKGSAAFLATAVLSYPDEERLAGWMMKALGFGPAVHVEGPARAEHLLFAFRGKPGQRIVHVANVASRAKGRRIVPASAENIDREPPLASIELHLPAPERPKSVRVVPPQTRLADQAWENGVLKLKLENVDVHAALLIETPDAEPARFLAASTPLAEIEKIGERYEQDFEGLPPGKPLPKTVGVSIAGGKTAIVVTNETAAGGTNSLKFTDHPDAPAPYQPYFYVEPFSLRGGTGRVYLDLRLEKGAETQIELREVQNAREFPVGPSVRFAADGQLRLTGKDEPLAAFPVGRWFGVEIVFRLDGSDRFDLKLAMDTGADTWLRDLPCRGKNFTRCGWIGVMGAGLRESVFYVDNLTVERLGI